MPAAFLQYGVERGLFRGLDVRVTPSQGGATVVPGVVSGSVDVGGSNLVSVLLARGRGIPLEIVAPGTFVGRRDFSAILASPRSGIRSPKDLEGRTLAVNTLRSVAEVTARASLERKGVNFARVRLAEVDFPDMAAALEAGRVDAAFAIEPFVTTAARAGNRVIDRPYTGTRRGLQVGCFFTSRSYLAENRAAVGRFRAGVAATARAIAADPGRFRAFLPGAARIPAPAAARVALPEWRARGDRASIALTARLMRRYGLAGR